MILATSHLDLCVCAIFRSLSASPVQTPDGAGSGAGEDSMDTGGAGSGECGAPVLALAGSGAGAGAGEDSMDTGGAGSGEGSGSLGTGSGGSGGDGR